ncbi:hypothetical protein DPMN_058166, partial [Dreissena polymorpha]
MRAGWLAGWLASGLVGGRNKLSLGKELDKTSSCIISWLMMKRSAFGLKVARAAQRVHLAASGSMLRGLRVSDAAPACPDPTTAAVRSPVKCPQLETTSYDTDVVVHSGQNKSISVRVADIQ